mgnify:CR=1 FL=1
MAARCFVVGMGEISKKHPPAQSECIPGTRQMLGILPSGGAVLALFPAMVATGTDRIFANLFWMGVMIWRK